MIAVTLVLGVLAGLLLLPTVSDALSLLFIARSRGRSQPSRAGDRNARLLFLVPAHDEELLITSCVRSLKALRYPASQLTIVVVADNCGDRTAALAGEAGAICLQRRDLDHPGKPRAIAWALQQLPLPDYDAVVIVDADTIVDAEFASRLAAAGPLAYKAVQGYFDVSNPGDSPLTTMATVLAAATHQFAYPLKRRAGLNVPLVGNGMAVGARILQLHGWQAFSICEDWEMYAWLTERGVRIECAPDARVYSQEARTLDQSATQRQRWTAGKLTVLGRLGPRLLRSAQIGIRQKLDALAELAAPGPALHLGLVVLLAGLAAALHPPATTTLVVALAASLVRPVAYTIAALAVRSDRARALRAFAFLPLYVLWRVGAAALALSMVGDKPWIRTARHPHTDA